MPDKIQFTTEEKNLLIQKRKEYIAEFNQYLPDEQKLVYDEAEFKKQLDDEANVKYYKSLKELEYRMQRQKEIHQKLIEDYGNVPNDRDLLARSFSSQLRVDNTKEAQEYNEKLYLEYQNDPDKALYKRYKNVLEFNPQTFLNVIDDKQKLIDFYLKNQALCDDAYVYTSTFDSPDSNINKNLRNSISGMQKLIQDLNFPRKICSADMVDYLSFPEITMEQANMIAAGNPTKYMGLGTKMSDKFNQLLTPVKAEETKEAYKIIKDHGFTLGKGFFLKYVAEEHDPKTNTTKEISVDDGIRKLKDNPNVTVRERTVDEIRELIRINKVYDREYVDIWQHKFSEKYDYKPYDFDAIKNANKGGFFERFFRTTSREYNNFIKALEDFNDPTSPKFGDKNHLRDSAQAYLDHKTAQGLSFNHIDNTGRGRLILVTSVINAIDEMDDDYNQINTEINNRIFSETTPTPTPTKEAFLTGAEVNDNFISNNIENIPDPLVKNNELDL